MKKRDEQEGSSDRLLRSKYSYKDRQRTVGMTQPHNRKIMLTDLCAEQKLKIGQLIKVNESRRLQIEELTQQLCLVKSKLAECQAKCIQHQALLESRSQEKGQLSLQLDQLQGDIRQSHQLISQLEEENCRLGLQVEKQRSTHIKKEHKFTSTQPIQTLNFGIQTKKGKTKERLVQTAKNEEQQNNCSRDDKTRRNHSKSLQQGAKGKWTPKVHGVTSHKQSIGSFSNSFSEAQPFQRQVDKLEDDVDECFQDLTHKWLQLKEKNISRLKVQYEDSKQKLYPDQHTANFNQQLTIEEQQGLDVQGSEKPKDTNDIDDLQLNRLLKSNNFSASRLLNSKANQESVSSRKKSNYFQNLSHSRSKQSKSKREPLVIRNEDLNLVDLDYSKKEKGSVRQDNQPKICNFQDNLMDLVDSLE